MSGVHQGQPVRAAGAPVGRARVAMVLLHGRGATAEGILALAAALETPEVAYVAPQAAENSWYPHSFLAPIPSNEPGISSGLLAITELLSVVESAGVPRERTLLLGFSQGACLALEYAARHASRYGGVVGLSGGLIGPEGTPREYTGGLAGTPVFLGCSDVDVHIPAARVRLSGQVMHRLGGQVTLELYPGMGHLVNGDELSAVRAMLAAVAKAA